MAKETFSSLIDLFKTASSSSVQTIVCDVCGNKLSVFRKKKPCVECKRLFCSQCLQRCRDRALRCKNCYVLTMRPPLRSALLDLRVKDLQHYLNQHNVSTRGCLEKEDLVNVLFRYASAPVNASSGSSGNPQFQEGNLHNSSVENSVPGNSQGPSSNSLYPRNSSQTEGQSPSSLSGPSSSSNLNPTSTPDERKQTQSSVLEGHSTHREQGDSDSSSNTSFEIVHLENVTSLHSSSSSSSVSKVGSQSNSTCATPSVTREEINPRVSEDTDIVSSELQVSVGEGPQISGMVSALIQGDQAVRETPDIRVQVTESGASVPEQSEPIPQPSASQPTSSNNSSNNSPNLLRGTMASITSEADFECLSVKQLKDILHRHRVNYHGCCEKAELVERAKRLYRDYQASRAELEKLDLDALCKICMDAPVECVMLECGHMATCTDCGRQLSECPICRQFVVRIVRTFKA